MSGNSGAWGIALWKDGHEGIVPQAEGISLSGGDAVDPYLPTVPLGFLTVPPEGLGVPPVRAGDVAFAQRDGVVQFADYYEPRILTFQVDIPNEGCPGCPSARQAVARLTQEWSRNCTGATLVIFSDCHDPDATLEEQVYLGPYMVHGRPRAAEVTWRRSDVGGASVLLRFDAADARLLLFNAVPDSLWDPDDVQTIEAVDQNLLPSPTLDGLTMTLNGATVSDDFLTDGGPTGDDGGPYFRRHITDPNTTSPMVMALSDGGVDAIPVTAGSDYVLSAWARKSVPGGPVARIDWQWLDAGGAQVSLVNGASIDPIDEWQQWSDTRTAPAGAAFLQPRLVWSGIALDEQLLSLAQAWLNEGTVLSGPEQMEVGGTLCAYPVITLSPNLTAPVTVNYGNHEFIYTQNVTSPIEIDTRYGRAWDGFVDVTQYLAGDFSSPVAPGVHDVSVQTADPTDTGQVNFVWQNAVVSG